MFNFQDFPGPVLFQDFPVPGIFKKKNPGHPRTFREAWEPCLLVCEGHNFVNSCFIVLAHF